MLNLSEECNYVGQIWYTISTNTDRMAPGLAYLLVEVLREGIPRANGPVAGWPCAAPRRRTDTAAPKMILPDWTIVRTGVCIYRTDTQ